MWKVLQAVVLFATAGLVLSQDAITRAGFEASTLMIIVIGLGITMMLMYRSLVSLLVLVMLAILIKLPDTILDTYGLDRDLLLAGAIVMLILPWLHKVSST